MSSTPNKLQKPIDTGTSSKKSSKSTGSSTRSGSSRHTQDEIHEILMKQIEEDIKNNEKSIKELFEEESERQEKKRLSKETESKAISKGTPVKRASATLGRVKTGRVPNIHTKLRKNAELTNKFFDEYEAKKAKLNKTPTELTTKNNQEKSDCNSSVPLESIQNNNSNNSNNDQNTPTKAGNKLISTQNNNKTNDIKDQDAPAGNSNKIPVKEINNTPNKEDKENKGPDTPDTMENITIENTSTEIDETGSIDIMNISAEASPAQANAHQLIAHINTSPIKLIEEAIRLVGSHAFTSRIIGDRSIFFIINGDEAHDKVRKLLIQEGCIINYKNGPQKPNLVVFIKGLYASLPTEYIHNELLNIGITPISVKNVVGNITGAPTNLFKVELLQNESSMRILKLTSFLTIQIKVTRQHQQKKIYQCYRCQKFDHHVNNCIHDGFICFKCAGPHSHKECTKPSTVPGKCSNCNGDHIASYHLCPAYIQAANKQARSSPTIRAEHALQSLGWANEPVFNHTNPRSYTRPERASWPTTRRFRPAPNLIPFSSFRRQPY